MTLKPRYLFMALITVLALPGAAHANRIINCDTEPHKVVLNLGNEKTSMVFAPGHEENIHSPQAFASFEGGREVELRADYDYCIWKTGIEKQKHDSPKGR